MNQFILHVGTQMLEVMDIDGNICSQFLHQDVAKFDSTEYTVLPND